MKSSKIRHISFYYAMKMLPFLKNWTFVVILCHQLMTCLDEADLWTHFVQHQPARVPCWQLGSWPHGVSSTHVPLSTGTITHQAMFLFLQIPISDVIYPGMVMYMMLTWAHWWVNYSLTLWKLKNIQVTCWVYICIECRCDWVCVTCLLTQINL